MYATDAAQPNNAIGSGGLRDYPAVTQGQGIPLSQDIMQRTISQLATAREISARLWQLRDRLLGSNPEPVGRDGPKPEHNHFSGAFNDTSSELSNILNGIDGLSAELANRL